MYRSVLATAFVAIVACKPTVPSAASVQNLAADTSVKNFALVFTGSTDGIPGVDVDPQNIAQVFGPGNQYGFNFELVTMKDVSTTQIKEKSAEIAGRMLAESPNGTLFWYLSSHGSDDGALVTADGSIYFDDVAREMRKARKDVPLTRLVVLIDSCFAGQSVTGDVAITRNSGAPGGKGFGDAFALADTSERTERAAAVLRDLGPKATREARNATLTAAGIYDDLRLVNGSAGQGAGAPEKPGLYTQAVIIGSSSPREESTDTEAGGEGTLAFKQAMAQLKSRGGTPRIKDLFTMMKDLSLTQTPVFHVDPEEVETDTLFGVGSNGGGAAPATPPAKAAKSGASPAPAPAPSPPSPPSPPAKPATPTPSTDPLAAIKKLLQSAGGMSGDGTVTGRKPSGARPASGDVFIDDGGFSGGSNPDPGFTGEAPAGEDISGD